MKSMELWEFCEDNLLDEKIFIVPSRSIGLQMINKITREGNRTLNLKPLTLQRLAFEICEEYIVREDKLIIDDILGSNLVMDILKDLHKKDPSGFFFKKELIDIRTAEEVYKVIVELKHNGLGVFPEEKDLHLIYEEYEKRLDQLNAMDYQDVIVKAKDMEGLDEYREKKIGLAYNIEFENVEKELLERLIKEDTVRIIMPVKGLVDKPKNYYFREEVEGPELGKRSIHFYEAYGQKAEIQYVIDDIMKKNIGLDQVVLAYTNGKYADLINIEFESKGLSIGFGQGLGIQASSVYRFIETIFNWAQNYHSINEIRPIFINRDLKIDLEDRKAQGSISPASMYEELIRSKVLYGRDNYRRILEIEEDDLKRQGLADYLIDRRLWLKEFFQDLFQALPNEELFCLGDYIPGLVRIIDKYVRIFNKYDGAALGVVYETLGKIEDIDFEVTKEEYFNIVLSYIGKARILRSQAQPGQVFSTSYKNAGYTGRKHLYLLGLDSDSLSNKIMESPILLDNIRREISDNLAFSKESYKYKKYKIKELLTGDFETISLGFSNFDTVDVKEKSPSQVYTELKDLYDHRSNDGPEKLWQIKGRDLVKSGTALETLGECSRKAYLKYKLGLRPLDEVEIRVDRWLDGLTRGNLVHEVLSNYFDLREMEEEGLDLRVLVEEACERTKKEVPYAIEEVYQREKEELYQICENIIVREEEDRRWKVLVNELSFGDSWTKNNRIFGNLPPVEIDLEGERLMVAGSIDRVDFNINKENLFRIIDYKTGSKDNFEKRLRKKEGRGKNQVVSYEESQKFQYYIYAKALEEILKTRKDLWENPEIKSFTYIFPGEDDKALIDLELKEEFLEEIGGRIKYLLNLDILEEDKTIVYDPDDNLRCKYCDYKSICLPDKDLSQAEKEGQDGE